jgi:hypothetical protein
MIRLRSIQEHLNRWVLVHVSLAILVGLVGGHLLAAASIPHPRTGMSE